MIGSSAITVGVYVPVAIRRLRCRWWWLVVVLFLLLFYSSLDHQLRAAALEGHPVILAKANLFDLTIELQREISAGDCHLPSFVSSFNQWNGVNLDSNGKSEHGEPARSYRGIGRVGVLK